MKTNQEFVQRLVDSGCRVIPLVWRDGFTEQRDADGEVDAYEVTRTRVAKEIVSSQLVENASLPNLRDSDESPSN